MEFCMNDEIRAALEANERNAREREKRSCQFLKLQPNTEYHIKFLEFQGIEKKRWKNGHLIPVYPDDVIEPRKIINTFRHLVEVDGQELTLDVRHELMVELQDIGNYLGNRFLISYEVHKQFKKSVLVYRVVRTWKKEAR
jgi:hypothetical protein